MVFPFLLFHYITRVHFSSTNTSFSLLRDFHLAINLSRIAEIKYVLFFLKSRFWVIGRSLALNNAANFPLYFILL